MQTSTTKSSYRPDIDGLRAFAIVAVVLFHADVKFIASGFVGVDIFFVISGFLIGGIVYREANKGSFSFRTFYARRFKRILPALITVVLFIDGASLIILSPSELKETSRDIIFALLGVSNIGFWSHIDYFAQNANFKMLVMTWSLGVEEQFYLIAPIIIIASVKFVPKLTIYVFAFIVSLSFALCLKQTYQHPATAFYLLPARAWELGVGVLLAIWHVQRPRLTLGISQILGLLGFATLLTSVCIFDKNTPFPGLAAALPVAGTSLTLMAEDSFINRNIFGSKPIVFIGLISYSWYLWHWPLITLVKIVTADTQSDAALLVVAAASIVPAYFSWRYIEQPYRHNKSTDHQILWRYTGVVAACLLLTGAVRLASDSPFRTSAQVANIERAVKASGSGTCLAAWGADKMNLDSSCASVDKDAPTLVIIGDSHAGALGPEVRNLASENGMGFKIIAKSSCRPLSNVSVWRKDQPSLEADCAAFMKSAFETVANDDKVRVVLLAGLWAGPLHDERYEHYVATGSPAGRAIPTGVDDLTTGLTDATSLLMKNGKTVVVVGDTPHWNSNPVNAMLNDHMRARRWLAALTSTNLKSLLASSKATDPKVRAVNEIVERVTAETGSYYLNTFDHFCTAHLCSYSTGTDPLFIDTSHVSLVGAKMALADLRPILRASIAASQPAPAKHTDLR